MWMLGKTRRSCSSRLLKRIIIITSCRGEKLHPLHRGSDKLLRCKCPGLQRIFGFRVWSRRTRLNFMVVVQTEKLETELRSLLIVEE